jgi:two-component system, LuxR family, response regulator FixJ
MGEKTMNQCRVSVIEGSSKRKAEIVNALHGLDIHAEPYSCIRDLLAPEKHGGIFFVGYDNLENLLSYLGRSQKPYAIIVHDEEPELGKVVCAIRKGAVDYLAWPATRPEIKSALREAEAVVSRQSSADAKVLKARFLVSRLTNREREVIRCVAGGMTNREIASQMGISHRTIEIHRSNALLKLEANNSPEAVTVAHDAGLIN